MVYYGSWCRQSWRTSTVIIVPSCMSCGSMRLLSGSLWFFNTSDFNDPFSVIISLSCVTVHTFIFSLELPFNLPSVSTFSDTAELCDMAGSNKVDAELQEFMVMEQQKAMLQAEVHKLTGICWEKCLDKPRDKLDYHAERCISNCVERFMDTTVAIATRFQSLLQKQMWNRTQLRNLSCYMNFIHLCFSGWVSVMYSCLMWTVSVKFLCWIASGLIFV